MKGSTSTQVFSFLTLGRLLLGKGDRYLSMTARHSFLRPNRLPAPVVGKVPDVAETGGGVCLHSGSSIGIGAGLILSVAPENKQDTFL